MPYFHVIPLRAGHVVIYVQIPEVRWGMVGEHIVCGGFRHGNDIEMVWHDMVGLGSGWAW
jgi:hypothetical protein